MRSISRRNFIGVIGTGAAALGLNVAASPGLEPDPIKTNNDMKTNEQNTNRTVILLAHPAFDRSVANRALVEAVKGLAGVTVIDMYAAPFTQETYRQPLDEASTVVFQFPFHWLSAPSQLKKWCDELFMTDLVKGKKLLVATTTGSEYEAYRSGGRNLFTVDELLRPYQALAHHSGMVWQTPFAVYGMTLPTAAQSLKAGAAAYRELILSLTK